MIQFQHLIIFFRNIITLCGLLRQNKEQNIFNLNIISQDLQFFHLISQKLKSHQNLRKLYLF
ncbi:hypothetical protein pb186bvf_021215 [Paramecium bursaria]